MISPPPSQSEHVEHVEHVEMRLCADIPCLAEETYTAQSQDEVDEQFRMAGWQSDFCPVHARRR